MISDTIRNINLKIFLNIPLSEKEETYKNFISFLNNEWQYENDDTKDLIEETLRMSAGLSRYEMLEIIGKYVWKKNIVR